MERWQLSREEVFVEVSARLPEAPPDLVDVPTGARSFRFPLDSEGLGRCVVRFQSASGDLAAEVPGGGGVVPPWAARASVKTTTGRPWSGWFKFKR